MANDAAETLDSQIPQALAQAAAYPDDRSAEAGIDVIQTHISWVFLTGDRVYKLKKSVDVGFVSFTTLHARNGDCETEVALNRRLAPDLYLGVAPIEPAGEAGFRVGPIDPSGRATGPGEHCVVMRRLPPGRDAETLLARGALPARWLGAAAEQLAAFHAEHGLGRPAPFSAAAWRDRIRKPVLANFDALLANRSAHLSPHLSEAEIEELRAAAIERFDGLHDEFEARRLAGRAVDGHGDLHLQHVWFERDDGVPIVIDCLEFSDDLRRVDAASEVAFLAMDLAYRGYASHAEHWLARYAEAADDADLYRVVDFFVSYRAAVRAKVAAIESCDAGIPPADRERHAQDARDRVAFARDALRPRAPGALILVGGLIGSGKSTVARLLAEQHGGVVLSSDAIRRNDPVAQAAETDPSSWQQGRYAPEAISRIYDAIASRAEAIVGAGRTAILDASWSRAELRARARGWAAKWGATCSYVEARCGRDETLARLEKRKREGRDASEAGPEIYDAFASAWEPVEDGEWAAPLRSVVHTDRPDWRDTLALPEGRGETA